MEKIELIGTIFAIFLIILIGSTAYYFREKETTNWEETYTQAMSNQEIPIDFLSITQNYDYNNPEIQSIINEFNSKSFSKAEDLIHSVGDEVYPRIKYREDLSYMDCVNTKASDVLERGYGLCSTMSKVYISIFRGLGLATRSVTGCVKSSQYYTSIPIRFQEQPPLQAIIGKITMREPKIAPIKIEDGIAVSRGNIHTWLEIWIPERSWTIFEPTTGYLIDKNSPDYKTLKVEPNSNEFCGLSNKLYSSFIQECSNF